MVTLFAMFLVIAELTAASVHRVKLLSVREMDLGSQSEETQAQIHSKIVGKPSLSIVPNASLHRPTSPPFRECCKLFHSLFLALYKVVNRFKFDFLRLKELLKY